MNPAEKRVMLAEERTELAEERTELAKERTVMANLRTAITTILFGITFIGLSEQRWDLFFFLGLITSIGGIGLLIFSVIERGRHIKNNHDGIDLPRITK